MSQGDMSTALRGGLSKLSMPDSSKPVYKEECVYSFDTPENPHTGLFISLSSYVAVGAEFLDHFSKMTGETIFLNYRRVKTARTSAEEPNLSKKPCKLGIGIEGGFGSGQVEFDSEDNYEVYVHPGKTTCSCEDPTLPELVRMNVQHVVNAQSPKASSLPLEWDGERRKITNQRITQINEGKTIPASGWKCERCDLTTNLWLNLTDGSIMCGRKFFDGSGGNNHAVDYYAEKKFPLAVKLGTITSEGKGDVFSYPEDDMVENPLLKEHLRHFSIHVEYMKKTEKTVAELEVEINQTYEWKLLTESDASLERKYGPEYTGIRNLGNTCYVASVMQVLYHLPFVRETYLPALETVYNSVNPTRDAQSNLTFQLVKLFNGLFSGKYSTPGLTEGFIEGVTPISFKRCVGGNHPEFRTANQQDAQEFMMYLFGLIEKSSQLFGKDFSKQFEFVVQEKIMCSVTNAVKYDRRNENMLSLFVPIDQCINSDEVKAFELMKQEYAKSGRTVEANEFVVPKVPFSALLTSYIEQQVVSNFRSSAAKSVVDALKTTSLVSFPKFLIIHTRRFGFSTDWRPNKMEVSIDMPEVIDLSALRSPPRPAGEVLMPEESSGASNNTAFEYNEEILASLASMGFGSDGSKRACFFTQNGGAEVALNWLMEHIDDSDLNSPFTPPGQGGSVAGASETPPEGVISMVMDMGFSRVQAINALKNTNNDMERAIDWIFSHPDEANASLDAGKTNAAAAPAAQNEIPVDMGPAKYKLLSFISHMGPSALCGHYVAHILIDGQWVLFNDEKVAVSAKPPKDLGYLYIYEKLSS